MVSDKVDEIFKENDFIISPTTPDVAFKFGANTDDPIKMYLEDIYTVMSNLAGIPAISFPIGTNSEGLPFSMQVMAPKFKESEAFSASISLA